MYLNHNVVGNWESACAGPSALQTSRTGAPLIRFQLSGQTFGTVGTESSFGELEIAVPSFPFSSSKCIFRRERARLKLVADSLGAFAATFYEPRMRLELH